MRIDSQNLGGVNGAGSSGSVHSIDTARQSGAGAASDASYDTVSLSGASSLISLSKSLNVADKQSRIAQLAAQVQSGTYQPDLGAASRALIGNQW